MNKGNWAKIDYQVVLNIIAENEDITTSDPILVTEKNVTAILPIGLSFCLLYTSDAADE